MEEAGKNGLDWDEDNLSEFLKNPRDFIPSRFGIRHTPMKRLVGSKKDRDDVIAYLKTL
ncbi:cytochrome c2 [bacterium MnTg02]|nr:cytochrome c2 [bacterium MnTg02]